jgi:aminoglycoside phosphotransferase (APT) family kinase protein
VGAVLGEHARLQLCLVDRVDELARLGVPQLPTAALPEHFEALLADDVRWCADSGLRDRLRQQLPVYRSSCALLADAVVPMSLQHDDLHSGNVLAAGTRFFDWGDACLGHPFAVLLVSLRSARHTFSLDAQDKALHRMRDAYLDPWSAFGSRAELLVEASLAVHVAKVSRALSWQRALVGADDDALREWGDSLSGWLGELLEPDVL